MDTSHRITVCTSCRNKARGDGPGSERPGIALIDALRGALYAAESSVPERYDVAGVACMAACDRPCAVAYQASGKATYVFGDIEPATDLEDLVRFAAQYAYLHDGWCSSVDRPGKLRKATVSRVPALAMGGVRGADL